MKIRIRRLRSILVLSAVLSASAVAYAQPPQEASLEAARETAAINPRDVEAQLSLARSALAAGQASEAVRAAATANSLSPNDSRVLPLLAEAQARSGQLTESLATFESMSPELQQASGLQSIAEAIRLAQQAEPILQQAAATGSDAEYRRAIEILSEAVESAPNILQLRKSLGFLYLDTLHEPQFALPQLEAALQIAPEDREAQALLGRTLLELGQFQRSASLLRGIVADQPSDIYNRLNLAEALLGLDRRDEAADIIEQVLEREPSNERAADLLEEARLSPADADNLATDAAAESDLRTAEAKRLFQLANEFLAAGDKSECIADYREAVRLLCAALKIEPNSHSLHKTLGYVYLEKLGQPALAYRHLRRALAIRPGDLETLKLYALASLRVGNICEAIRLFQAVLRRDPDDLWMRVNLGRAWARAGEYDRATAIYNNVLCRDPRNFTARLGIAEILTWRGLSDQPIAITERLVAEDPRSSEALSLLGDLYRYDWDFDPAVQAYRRARANDPAERAGLEGLSEIEEAQSVSASTDGYYFEDNFGFRRSFIGGSVRIPLSDKAYLIPRAVYWDFGQGTIDLNRTDAILDLEYHFNRHLQATTRFWNYDYSNREDEQAGSVSLQYTPISAIDLYLSGSANEPAVLTDINIPLLNIRMDNYASGYDVDLNERWSTQGAFSYSEYSDDNERRFVRTQLSYKLLPCYDVFGRIKYEKLSFSDQTPLYFSPNDFELLRLGTDFVLPLRGRLFVAGETEAIDTLGEGWGHSVRIGPAYRTDDDVEFRASYINVSIPGAAPFSGDGFEFFSSYRF